MNKWLLAGLFIVTALSVGTAIVPSGLERAFMSLYDKEYNAAQHSFEARWLKGDHSREVANALSELLMRLGDADRASEVLLTFVNENPGDGAALARLAEIFRDSQRRDKHIATLERLWVQKKDPALLRTLDALYDFAGREEDRIRVLTLLVRSKDSRFEDHAELAGLLTARDPRAALEALFNAFKRWPSTPTPDNAQTFIALAGDAERNDLVVSVIEPWIQKRADHAAMDAVVVTLTATRRDALALRMGLASGALAKSVPQSIVLVARLEARGKQTGAAFARLEGLRKTGKLPAKGDDVYVETALLTKHRDEALAHILARGPDALPFWLQSWIVAKAVENDDKEFLKTLESELTKRPDTTRAFMLSRAAFALGAPARALDLARESVALIKDASSGIAVAGLFSDLGLRPQAQQIFLDAVGDGTRIPADDLTLAISVAITLKEARLSLTMAEALRAARPGETAEVLYARALTASNRSREALEVLDELPDWSEQKELAVFEALKASGQLVQLQRRLFERLEEDNVTLVQRTNYAFMLNDFKELPGKISKGAGARIADDLDDDALQGAPRLSRIELLGKLDPVLAKPYALDAAENDPDGASYIYIALLKKLNANQETVDFLAKTFEDAELEKTRETFLYRWIEIGVTAEALPHLRERAEGDERSWFFAYDDALKKLGARAERVRFLTAYARRGNLDAAFKGQISHELLGVGAKDEALNLFLAEAAHAPVRSPAVEQLLFIWGPRPPEAGVEWISSRARSANPDDRQAWLQRLADAGAVESMVAIAQKFYHSGERALSSVLAGGLAQLKLDTGLRQVLTTELTRGDIEPAVAARLGTAAEERSLAPEASRLFEIAAAANKKWLAQAGRNAWFSGDKLRGLSLLEQAAAQAHAGLETIFLCAEAYRSLGRVADAKRLYLKALELSKGKSGREERRMQMLALMRLGRLDEAEAHMAGATDAGLRADYAAALLDGGRLERAAQILGPVTPR